jgi:NADH-quinone oxidoreductase subunit A
LMRTDLPLVQIERTDAGNQLALTPAALALQLEMGIRNPVVPAGFPANESGRRQAEAVLRNGARGLAWTSTMDILVFFAVLMVGFLYVWRRGDLDWVRALAKKRGLTPGAAGQRQSAASPSEAFLSA